MGRFWKRRGSAESTKRESARAAAVGWFWNKMAELLSSLVLFVEGDDEPASFACAGSCLYFFDAPAISQDAVELPKRGTIRVA
jgi:hypothetical protein